MTKIDIDVSPWLDEEGVISSLYFGNACEPAHEEILPYEQLIDRALESFTVRDVIRDVDYADAEAFVKALEQAAAYARTKLESMGKSDE
jgi:hypothetical protein